MTEAARREQILQAAERLLKHYGPHKTTVADVAREAGVGVGSVYLEFDSKDAIIEELSRSRYRAVLDAMRKTAGKASRPFRDRLTAALDARLEAYFALADEGAHACDLVHCMSSAVKSASDGFHTEQLALFTDLLEGGKKSGEFALRDPEKTARTLLRAYISFTPPWIFGKDRDELRRAMADLHTLVSNGLLDRPTTPKRCRSA